MFSRIFKIFIIGLLLVPLSVQAGVLDSVSCIGSGSCTLLDIETAVRFLTNWLIGGIGAGALLYFIWGAIQWITSYGNSEKIKHGRDVMVGSITAIVIAFASFLIIQFFINNVLLGGAGDENFQVKQECRGANRGSTCNKPAKNYVCTGVFDDEVRALYNNLCVTKCELMDLENDDPWLCLDSYRLPTESVGEIRVEPEQCPINTQVCVNASTLPPGFLTGGEDNNEADNREACCYFGDIRGCVAGVGNNPCGEEIGTAYEVPCGEVPMCDPGYVRYTSACCCDPENYSAYEVGYGEICNSPAFVIPLQAGQDCLDVC